MTQLNFLKIYPQTLVDHYQIHFQVKAEMANDMYDSISEINLYQSVTTS